MSESGEHEVERLEREVWDALPEQDRTPEMRRRLQGWARVQYLAEKAFALIMPMNYDDIVRSRGAAGQGKSLLELWKELEAKAARMRCTAGVTPRQWAALRKSLAIAQAAEADALRRLEEMGKAIREKEAGEADGELPGDI